MARSQVRHKPQTKRGTIRLDGNVRIGPGMKVRGIAWDAGAEFVGVIKETSACGIWFEVTDAPAGSEVFQAGDLRGLPWCDLAIIPRDTK